MGPLGAVIETILKDLHKGIKHDRSTLLALWPKIAGPQFAPHTKPLLEKEGTLCVWVDEPTLASELGQRYQGTLLKRSQGALGEAAVKKIKFRVGQIRTN